MSKASAEKDIDVCQCHQSCDCFADSSSTSWWHCKSPFNASFGRSRVLNLLVVIRCSGKHVSYFHAGTIFSLGGRTSFPYPFSPWARGGWAVDVEHKSNGGEWGEMQLMFSLGVGISQPLVLWKLVRCQRSLMFVAICFLLILMVSQSTRCPDLFCDNFRLVLRGAMIDGVIRFRRAWRTKEEAPLRVKGTIFLAARLKFSLTHWVPFSIPHTHSYLWEEGVDGESKRMPDSMKNGLRKDYQQNLL